MTFENQVVKPTNNLVFDVQNGLNTSLNSILELREDWIKKQRYENTCKLRGIRLGLEKPKVEFDKLTEKNTYNNCSYQIGQ